MMHSSERHLARATWAAASADPERLLGHFFDRLYLLDPSLRLLVIGEDPSVQGRTLLHTVGVAVMHLDRLDGIVARLHGDGDLDDGGVVGAALLWAVEQSLGPALWTPPVRVAWQHCVALLARSQRSPSVGRSARVA